MDYNNENKLVVKRKTWQTPWSYKEGFLISIGLIFIGLLLEYFTGSKGIGTIHFPVNLVVLLALLNGSIFLFFLFRKNTLVYWLSTIPAALSAIVGITFLTILLGSIPQQDNSVPEIIRRLGLSHLVSSFPFLFITLYFLSTLGLVTVRRAFPFTKKNIGFFINHFGLWLIIAVMALGSGDLQRITMNLKIGDKPISQVITPKGEVCKFPFSIKLLNFQVNEYNPKIGLVDNKKMEFVIDKNINVWEIKNNFTVNYFDWNISIEKFYKLAIKNDSEYIESKEIGAAPVALVCAKNTKGTRLKGWITCGSMMMQYQILKLDEKHSLGMSNPSPKSYISDIEYITKSGKSEKMRLEVNKPQELEGWKIYQTGFNEELGRWSDESIIELVKDPWLPLIYTGFFLLIAGSVYIFWIGKTKNTY